MKKIVIILYLFILLFSFSLFCAEKSETEFDYKIRRISPEGGLDTNGQRDVKQDKWGFIWVITVHDLYRFDGYTFKYYTNKIRKPNPYALWSFNRLEIGKNGDVFVTTNYGLLKYNPLTDTFDCLFENGDQLVKEDNNNNLWVSNQQGIGIFDRNTCKFKTIKSNNGQLNVVSLIYIKRKDVYIGTKTGKIYKFDSSSNKFCLVFSKRQYNIVDISEADNLLYVLTENSGLIVIRLADYKETKVFDFFYPEGDTRVPARALYIDKYGHIWITSQRGIYILNPKTGNYSHYYYDKTEPNGLPSSSVWRISEDGQGNLWFGTYSGGLCFVNPNENRNIKSFNGKADNLSYPVVSSFAEDLNSIWIGTEGGGLNRYNKQTNTFSYYRHNPSKNSLSYNNIQSLLLMSNNKLWIGMSIGGLDCLDIKTGHFINYGTNNGACSLLNSHIERIVAEADSGIWIKYLMDKDHLTYLSLRSNKTTHFNFLLSPFKTKGKLNDIVKGNKDTLWIASSYQLLIMNTRTRKVSFAQYKSSEVSDYQNLNISTIYADNASNILWLGTKGYGLLKYHVKERKLTIGADLSKYNVHLINSLNKDNNGNVWIGTDNGLFRLNIKTNKLQQFNKADGTQGQIYYPFSTFKSYFGDLYFGGNEGFTLVTPSKITYNKYKPKVIVSEFLIDNKPVMPGIGTSPLKSSIFQTNELELKYNQNNFTFEFASTNYLNPTKNRFKYRLKGYDDSWIETDANHRSASYAKVPRGNYSFEIMTANNDEVWGELTSIQIVVMPAPWLSIWALLIYILLIGFILRTVIRYYNDQRKLKMQVYLKEKEKEQKEEYHQAQLRFFTNVSHDFRTPLSLIFAAIDAIKNGSSISKHFITLENNARRLMNLTNELMDFRSLQNNKVTINLSVDDWNKFVNESCTDFIEYAQHERMNFKVELDATMPSKIFFDHNIVEKILLNLLNNAFKYSSANGEITIRTLADISTFESKHSKSFVATKAEDNRHLFGLVISDKGVGISEASIVQVFERYFRVDESSGTQHLGSGIGLALVKNMVELHEGYVAVFSERDKGTDILVGFPVDISVYPAWKLQIGTGVVLSSTSFPSYHLMPQITETTFEKEFSGKNDKQILIVEDNSELRGYIVGMLRSYYNVYEAENGLEAIKVLEKEDIDLVLTDVMMPHMNGIELCNAVRDNFETSHILIVMLTAKTGVENQIEGLHSGADVYLEKPINKDILLLSLLNLFKQQERIREYYAKYHFANTSNSEAPGNKRDAEFMEQLIKVLDNNLSNTEIDVLQLASNLAMSRRKLYGKVKALTGQSIVEFIRNYRLRKAAQILIEEDISISIVMDRVGIDNASYFSRIFKNEFGESPSSFVSKHRKDK